MKKMLWLTMPLLLTAAFSFPDPALAQNIAASVVISEADTLVATNPTDITDGADSTDNADNVPAAVVLQLPDSAVTGEDSLPAVTDEASDSPVMTDSGENTAEDTAENIEPEPSAPDPFAGEPYAGSSLKDIEQHLEQSHKLAVKSEEFSSRALAIIAGTTDDRSFRRHCEFLVRIANHNIYAANVALLVFPRLLEVSNLICESAARALSHAFAGELIREPLAREIRLSELRNLLDTQAELARQLRSFSEQITDFSQQVGLQNSRRHVQGRIPEFLRAINRDMLILLEQQNGQFAALINQFEHHYQFCLVNIDYFLAVSDHAPGIMQASQLGRIFRSCNDFAFSLRNYREQFNVFAVKFEKLVQNRLGEIEILAGKESRRAARIAEFAGRYPERDRDEALSMPFSTQQILGQSFLLLGNMRNQAARLVEGEVDAAVSEEDKADIEAFAILQSILVRHLDSSNWPIIEFEALPQHQETTEE